MPAPENARRTLRVGGFAPLSATDWPGQLAAVVFCQGCPWRCGYCHNPHLLAARGATEIAWSDVLAFLSRREGLLDGIVFSGGEPLAQPGLREALHEVRSIGFRVALHTGGAYPRRLAEVLPLVDWVGFDVKSSFATYAAITGVEGSGDDALASAKLVIESGVAYEFRTTVHPAQLAPQVVERLADDLVRLGVRHYVLQAFRAQGCADSELARANLPSFLTEPFGVAIAPRFASFGLRLSAS
jgi:pyruvate formate lyase activating enzyme